MIKSIVMQAGLVGTHRRILYVSCDGHTYSVSSTINMFGFSFSTEEWQPVKILVQQQRIRLKFYIAKILQFLILLISLCIKMAIILNILKI